MRQPRTISQGKPSWRLLGVGLVTLVVLSACQGGTSQTRLPAAPIQPGIVPAAAPSAAAQAQAPAKAPAEAQAYTAKLQFTPPSAEVGKMVQLQGSGYPPNSSVELVWYTVQGTYQVDGSEFVGQRYTDTSRVLATVPATPNGEISTSLQVPLDFGGAHDVRGRVNNKEMSQASLTIAPTFTLTPTEGPVGTPMVLRITGVDSNINSNTWHLLYDNRYMGFVSAVMTNGVAEARLRAAGPIGDRAVSIWHNSFNPTPYLNWQQGPYKDTPVASFTFHVTSDPGSAAPMVEDFTATDGPAAIPAQGPGKLSLSRGPRHCEHSHGNQRQRSAGQRHP